MMAATVNPTLKWLRPAELARLWRCSTDTILALIHSGELRAVNVALTPHGRPRWVIDQGEVDSFQRRRANGVITRDRRRARPATVTEYV
jgi:excisionase family DNA binding protein